MPRKMIRHRLMIVAHSQRGPALSSPRSTAGAMVWPTLQDSWKIDRCRPGLPAGASPTTRALITGPCKISARVKMLIAAPDAANGSSYAIVKGASFRDGTIEVDLAGKPAAGAGAGARGFIGIAFRLQDNKYEYIYLRPTNGRAEDQVRRNHSTQYGSHPDFDFAKRGSMYMAPSNQV